ncbi:MAG TPA: hypothetical protein VI603_10430, partial [Saprospiraceae bacterium]|nr:hypothetical protein [Saprospiraceae bacterium]
MRRIDFASVVLFLLWPCFIGISPCHSQNLVPNSSFELYTDCPTELNQEEPLQAIPWVQGNQASADYFNRCATGPPGVPENFFGSQNPFPISGDAYSGGFAHHGAFDNYREYILTPLLSPLVPGSSYLVSFYISLADTKCGIQPFGALFTVNPPVSDDIYVLSYTPQIETNGEFLSDYTSWILISRCFIAEGGEQYITIGNFRGDEESPIDPDCDISLSSYYYIDSVSVEEMSLFENEFILNPAMACGSYEIFPGTAENYLWSDGTTNPTLTVIESGTYYVTLSNACAFSYGEIEVTIIPDYPPVALPNDTVLCDGESIEIILDPDAGTYEWNDDNTSNEYTISEVGIYIVSLTDDCDETSDTINVTFLEVPEPFSLGEDTLICDGDAFTISFDPTLGDFEWQDGSDGASYAINDDGLFALTLTNMCGEASDEIQVDFVQPIVFSIGPDQMTLCDGDEIEIILDPALGTFLWNDNS